MNTNNPAYLAIEKEKVMKNFDEIVEIVGVGRVAKYLDQIQVEEESEWADTQIQATVRQARIDAEIAEFDARNWFDRCHELAVYEPSSQNAAKEAKARADWDVARQKLEALK